MERPTSHAPSLSARRATKCATASPASSRAISRSLPRSSPRTRAGPSSTRWRARRSRRTARVSVTDTRPENTSGAQLGPLARTALWQAGLDFDHGTGHGVGSYLSVHEGPARISKLGGVALKRGMILSNEPGYYKTGAYGIRIENLVLVSAGPKAKGAEKPLNGFETLTLA